MTNGKKYTKREKVVIGGLGALTPLILHLLVVDLQGWWLTLAPFVVVGAILRVLALCYLGGIVAYLHRDENNPIKLFELGIVAPALITGLLHGAPEADRLSRGEPTKGIGFFDLLVTPVYAAEHPTSKPKTFSPPQETIGQQIWRGVTDSPMERLWFVIAAYHPTVESAAEEAREINRRARDFRAEVYSTYGARESYCVVIGEHLTLAEAQALRERAVEAGLAHSHVWKLPAKIK